ncbi:MAG: cytochrome c [bacterium]|nr:cytochrome c [bacterium]
MNVRLTLATLIVLACCGAGFACAEEPAAGNPLAEFSGKDLYKTACKPCHTEDAEGGEYTPMSLIQEQWDEFFDVIAETHGETTCPADDSKKLLDILDDNLLKKIRKFCVDHAADSEQPMTCG